MPKQVKDLKTFSELLKSEKSASAKDKSAPKKVVYVKQGKKKITKFKLRKAKYLYTFQTDKPAVSKKILESLANSNIQKVELKGKRVIAKKAGKK